MVGNKKKLVSKANISWLGGSMALWKEKDGSLYIALDNNSHTKFFGPLTEEQVAAYEVIRGVEREPDDWVRPAPLLDPASLPKVVRTTRSLGVLNGKTATQIEVPAGTEVMVYDSYPPTTRYCKHMISFRLIDEPDAVNSAASADCFDLQEV